MLSNSTDAEGTEAAEQKGYLSDQSQCETQRRESTGERKQRDVCMYLGSSRACRRGQWSPP